MAPSKAPPKLAKVSHPDAQSSGATLSAPSPRLEQYGVQVGHGRHPATQFWACRAGESLTIFCPPISQTRAQALQAAREAQLKTPPPMGQVRCGLGESFGRQKVNILTPIPFLSSRNLKTRPARRSTRVFHLRQRQLPQEPPGSVQRRPAARRSSRPARRCAS